MAQSSMAQRRITVINIRRGWRWSPLAVMATLLMMMFGAGCGHTDEEMGAKQREIDKLAADLKAARA